MIKRPFSGWWRLWMVAAIPITILALNAFVARIDAPYRETGPCPMTDSELVERDIAVSEREGREIAAYRERLSDVPLLFRSATAEDEIRADVSRLFPEERACNDAENAARQNAYALSMAVYPAAMVLWIAGAPAEALPRDVPEQHAVMQYRLAFQQAAVALAGQVSSIHTVHIADRTAFPWAMKDAGRETMAQLITTAVIGASPFRVTPADVQFRKLHVPAMSVQQGIPAGIVPVLGAATLHRIEPTACS